MSDNLRYRIAAAIESIRIQRDGDSAWMADAVIEELGLHRESQFTGDDGSDINVSEWDRERMKTPSAGWKSRYCTRWTVDE